MSIVIVEGPDGSGKTSLIRNLRETSKTYFWIASSSGRPHTVDQLQSAIHWLGQALYLKVPVICDRFPLISEAVYGPVIRHQSLLQQIPSTDHDLYQELLGKVSRIVYCRPHKSIIEANLSANPQMEGVKTHLTSLIRAYDEVMDELATDTSVIWYDYKRPLPPGSTEQLFFGRVMNG